MLGFSRVQISRRDERGAVLPLVALLIVALTGMVAMSVDIGQLGITRRKLQNAADAGALAGAGRLPADKDAAKATARQWAIDNGIAASEITSVDVSTTNVDDDTIQVNVRRNVVFSFARVLGFANKDVTATAKAQVFVTQGIDTQAAGMFPYAVWGGNKGGPSAVKPGQHVIFRSEQYAADNVQSILPACLNQGSGKYNNCNWNVQSNTFKGYFHWHNRYVYIDANTKAVFDQGGNAVGTEPVAGLIKFQNAGMPVWLPLITWADDAGTDLHFTVVNFVCVDLNLNTIDTNASNDFNGTVLDPEKDGRCAKGGGLRTGGENPGSGLMPVHTFALIQ